MRAARIRGTALAVDALFVCSLVAVAPAGVALAGEPETVPVVSYDIATTAVSGFGCWTHTYTGTITDTGRRVGGSVVCLAEAAAPIANYSGGSGTLNDGSTADAQLFVSRPDTSGSMFWPAITLHLARPVRIASIELIEGGYSDGSWNMFAGDITSGVVEIGGSSESVAPVPFGPPSYFGVATNDRFDLAATPLGDIVTDTVTLGSFEMAYPWPDPNADQFTIAEILVTGTAPPDPAAMLTELRSEVTAVAPGAALEDKVAQAQGRLADGRIKPACNALGDFADLVAAQAGKKLDAITAAQWTADTQEIASALDCAPR